MDDKTPADLEPSSQIDIRFDLRHFEGHPIRTFYIQGERLQTGPDLARALDFSRPNNLLRIVDEAQRVTLRRSDTAHLTSGIWSYFAPQVQEVTLISRAGVNMLLMRSEKDVARRFQRWLAEEVVPAIEDTGSYSVSQAAERSLEQFAIPQDMGEALQLAANLWKQRQVAIERVAELEPRAAMADACMTADLASRTVSQVAKNIGLLETELRQFLLDQKIIMRRYAPCGKTIYEAHARHTHHFSASEKTVQHRGRVCMHYTLRIMPSGQQLIVKRLRDAGMLRV